MLSLPRGRRSSAQFTGVDMQKTSLELVRFSGIYCQEMYRTTQCMTIWSSCHVSQGLLSTVVQSDITHNRTSPSARAAGVAPQPVRGGFGWPLRCGARLETYPGGILWVRPANHLACCIQEDCEQDTGGGGKHQEACNGLAVRTGRGRRRRLSQFCSTHRLCDVKWVGGLIDTAFLNM